MNRATNVKCAFPLYFCCFLTEDCFCSCVQWAEMLPMLGVWLPKRRLLRQQRWRDELRRAMFRKSFTCTREYSQKGKKSSPRALYRLICAKSLPLIRTAKRKTHRHVAWWPAGHPVPSCNFLPQICLCPKHFDWLFLKTGIKQNSWTIPAWLDQHLQV